MASRSTPLSILAVAAILAACATAPGGPDRPPPAAPPAPDAAELLRAADDAMRSARFDDAARRYEEAARLAPGDPRPPLGVARVNFALGRIPQGLEALDRSIALGETAEALYLRGRTLGIARGFDAAARDLERSLALGVGDGAAWPVLAAVQVNRGDESGARHAYEAAVKVLGEPAAVDRLWTMLLAMPPDPSQPQEALDRCARGQAAMFQGRWPEAGHEQRNALRKSPGFAYCTALLGVTAERLGEPATGERLLRKAIAEAPDRIAPLRADAQAWLAALLAGKPETAGEAVSLARASLAVRGERAATLDVLARACGKAGDAACVRDATDRLLRLQGATPPTATPPAAPPAAATR